MASANASSRAAREVNTRQIGRLVGVLVVKAVMQELVIFVSRGRRGPDISSDLATE
jgi:hypothetical protein